MTPRFPQRTGSDFRKNLKQHERKRWLKELLNVFVLRVRVHTSPSLARARSVPRAGNQGEGSVLLGFEHCTLCSIGFPIVFAIAMRIASAADAFSGVVGIDVSVVLSW
mmetsp:Transcript_487/g.776  ORF Transcript_487/g.776 Transcript_487/m.776 type:complete len:108 (-) Transcript_487:184-507(-)